ncbi:MAG TPA: hypothetical protein PK008_11245, partial [Aminivibrio sp.]|uniref:hypothetical protein n=1 Tax=Aminivibrio sp. TaxID=1872489 RepID=UPI002CE9E904
PVCHPEERVLRRRICSWFWVFSKPRFLAPLGMTERSHPEAGFWPKDLLLVQGFLKTEILRSAQDDRKSVILRSGFCDEGSQG